MIERAPKTNTKIRIEKMQLQDVEQVADLDIRCFQTPWSVSAYITELHNPSAYYIVVRAGEKIVGYAGMWIIMDESHITTIGVDPNFQGKKIGERMLLDIINESISRGAHRATLEVRKNNHAARNLYEKYGFRIVGIRAEYYTNDNEDALVMWVDNIRDPKYQKTLSEYEKELNCSS